MAEGSNLLLIEYDSRLAGQIQHFLQKHGYDVDIIATFQDAIRFMLRKQYHMVMCCISLPDCKELSICQNIRKYTESPILLLAEPNHKDFIFYSLQNGASDFIFKPLHLEELKIRTEFILQKMIANKSSAGILQFHSFIMDTNMHKLYLLDTNSQKTEVLLTPIEFDLLFMFVNHPNTLLLYEDLYRKIWETDCLDDVRTVMVHVSNLRKKLDANEKGIICTVRRAGYIFSDV